MWRCAIRANAPLAPAKVAAITKLMVMTRLDEMPRYSTRRLFSRTARLARPSSDRNRIVVAMPASPVGTTETAYSMKYPPRGPQKAEQNTAAPPQERADHQPDPAAPHPAPEHTIPTA